MTKSAAVSKPECIRRLAQVFRNAGYKRASLSELANATGLQRSSLYHYFPGGKAQMVREVIEESNAVFEETVLSTLQGDAPPRERFDRLLQSINTYYDSGRESCLLGVLTAEMPLDDIGVHVQNGFNLWISLLVALLQEHGFTEPKSRSRAYETVAAIQGALVLARGTGSVEVFRSILAGLPDRILR